MRSASHANTQAIDQFAAQPAAHKCDDYGYERQQQRTARGNLISATADQPASREQQYAQDIQTSMPEPDSLGRGPPRNCQPVDKPENGGAQATNDAGSDHPERQVEPR